MGYSEILGATLGGVVLFSLTGLVISSFSLTLGSLFMVLIVSSTYYYILFVGDYMTYMLFLVYLGGLLVLLIYMIMVAGNFSGLMAEAPNLFLASGVIGFGVSFLCVRNPTSEYKTMLSNSTFIINLSCVVLLVIFLLYVFLNICLLVLVGGRSLTLNAKT